MSRKALSWPQFVVVAAMLVATAVFLHSRSQAEALPPRLPLSSFPLKIGGWTGVNIVIPQWALQVLGQGEFAEDSYARNPNEPQVDLYMAYFPSQRSGSTIHSPQNCLPGSGWTPLNSTQMEIARPSGGQINVNRYILAKGMNRLLVLYWYQSHGRAVASEYWAKFFLVEDAIRMNRSDGALVRVSTAIADDETEAGAQRRAEDFLTEILPLLNNYIPR